MCSTSKNAGPAAEVLPLARFSPSPGAIPLPFPSVARPAAGPPAGGHFPGAVPGAGTTPQPPLGPAALAA